MPNERLRHAAFVGFRTDKKTDEGDKKREHRMHGSVHVA
jgi:hypothetical protein